MTARILIVEDEILIGLEIEAMIEDLGHQSVGIAPDVDEAMRLAETRPDIALVDLHLRDGLTGPQIGRILSEQFDVTVIFVTANPRLLGSGVPGTIGVMEKPIDEQAIGAAIAYAIERRGGANVMPPPVLRPFQSLSQ